MAWRPDRWLFGVPLLALAWAAGTLWATPHLEDSLKRAIQDQPGAADLLRAGARLDLRGRDAAVIADFALPDVLRRLVDRLAGATAGLRHVHVEVATPFAMRPFQLMIRRNGSRLTLRGGVPADGVHARLIESALALVGPDGIDDRLAPGLGAPPGFAPAAQTALRLAARLAQGEVTLTDGVLAIQGEAADFAAYNAIQAGLLELPLGFSAGRVDVVPPQAVPFAWSAGRGPDGLVLDGYVPSEAARKALREAAESALPGMPVLDRMQTARGLAAGVDFDALGRVALNALSRLASGRAAYDGARFAVSGAGPARDLVGELPGAIQRGLPSGIALGPVTIQPIPASPYLFAARRNGGRVTLTGYTPDQSVRDAMRGALERLLPTETVIDDLHLADGAPEGFAVAAGSALEAVAQLADGSAELTDRRLVLQGRALYPGLAKLAERRVGTGLPAGWTGLADIKAEPFEKPLEASLCADLLADAIRRDPPRFEPGKADISARSSLDALRDVVRRCGPARIRVIVRPEPGEDNEAARGLAGQRAATLAAALGRGNTARLAPVAFDPGTKSRPESASSKPGAERVAFIVEP